MSYSCFRPGEVWLDTEGEPIQAHGGGILHHQGTYYWYGEHKGGATREVTQTIRGETRVRTRLDVIGVSCYSSRDLYNWRNLGVVLPAVPDDPEHDLHTSKVLERPKVIFNKATGKFVMWFHCESADYQLARAGVAVADQPQGPYCYLGSFRPNNSMSRDMTLFVDEEGGAYQIYSSEKNSTLHVSALTDDYLRPSGTFTRNFEKKWREAPAIFRYSDTYCLITSGCTGWAPNEAEYAVSDSPLGPWKVMGNPCVGEGAERTFGGQSTYVLPVAGRENAYILMLDRWDPENLGDSRYIWLPVELEAGSIKIRWQERWDLHVFDE